LRAWKGAAFAKLREEGDMNKRNNIGFKLVSTSKMQFFFKS